MKNKLAIPTILAMLLFPVTGFTAAPVQRDILIKGASSSAVYYLASDDKRYVFPNENVYKSWFTNFDGIVTVTDADLASFRLGGNVTYRPGIRMVKITTDPKVYAVGKGGGLRWITSEAIATALFGSNWNKNIDDIPDTFFINYQIGSPVNFASDFNPTLEAQAVDTIAADKNLTVSFGARRSDTLTSGPDTSSSFGFSNDAPLSKPEIASRMRVSTAYIKTPGSSGSGFVIDSGRYILTNAHVVKGVSFVDIYLPGTGTFKGTVIGRDEYVDLALIRPDTIQQLPSSILADSSLLRAGDEVFAMGYPLIGLQTDPSFTEGSLSRVAILDGQEYLEISAEIHHGNSGGPLIDIFGKVIGINSRAEFGFGTGALKYAIPINRAKLYIPLLKNGLQNIEGSESTPSETVPESQPEENQCTADTWSCTTWSECSLSGSQDRVCTKAFECAEVVTPQPPEIQSCNPPEPTVPGVMLYQSAPSDTESEASIVIAGQSGVVLGKIRLSAQNEELKQSKIRISLVNSSSSANLISMSLYDGSTLVAGPVPVDVSGNADFSNMSFIVPKDSSKTLTVKATLNSIFGGAISGADLQITTDLSNPASSTFEYRGTSSSTVVTTISSTDVIGRQKILRKTKPTISLASLPTSTLTDGTKVLSRITITADSAEQVSVKHLKWSISKTSGVFASSGSASSVREVGHGSNIAGTSSDVGDCTGSATSCVIQTTFSSEQVISAGTSKTYELVMTISSTSSGDSISTDITSDTSLVTGSLGSSGTTVDGSAQNFAWSDNSAIPHDDADGGSSDWTNGFYVRVLPSDAQTLTAL